MGKSYRKSKHFGFTAARSEKKDKVFHHRKMRRRVQQQLHSEDFDAPFPVDNEVSNVWNFAKDGKQYWPDAGKRDLGK